jgi:hypothetical protein
MKTKLTIVALLCALNINANGNTPATSTSASLDLSYATDYYFRGQELGQESIQASVGAHADLGSFKVCGNVFTNQATASGSGNVDQVKLGLGKSFLDGLVTVYGGVLNTDVDGAGSELDVFVGGTLDTIIKPTVIVYRNSDDDLYTYEGSLAYTLETSVLDVTISGEAGVTDVTTSTDESYYGGSLVVSKDIGSLKPHASLAVIDGDTIDQDTIVSAGLTFQF